MCTNSVNLYYTIFKKKERFQELGQKHLFLSILKKFLKGTHLAETWNIRQLQMKLMLRKLCGGLILSLNLLNQFS